MVYRSLKKEYVQSPEPDSLTHTHIWAREVRKCCQKNLESHPSEAQPTRTGISATRTWTHSKKTRAIKQARLREINFTKIAPKIDMNEVYQWPICFVVSCILQSKFRVIFFWCISERCSESGLQLKTTEMWQGFLSFLFDIWHVHVMFSCIMAPLEENPSPGPIPTASSHKLFHPGHYTWAVSLVKPGNPHWSCSRLPLHIVVLISLLRLVIMVCHFSVDSIKSISSFYT